jgi:hypothetical protein
MGAWIWIGFGAFFLVSLAVGLRLLLLWKRTRELPELLIGIGVLGIGPVGFGCLMIGQLLGPSWPWLARTLVGAGMFAAGAGVVAKCVFNWRVYHPDKPKLEWLAWAAGLTLTGALIHSAWTSGFTDAAAVGVRYTLRQSLQVGCLLWGSAEALRYWVMMRKRVRLGLADPVVANRFLMWGIGAGAAGWGSFVGFVAQVISGVPSLQIPWVTVSSSLHGLVAAVALSLAFLPPEAYRRFIAARAEIDGAH